MAGAIAGIAGSLGGAPAVTGASENRPGDVLLVPGYGGSTSVSNSSPESQMQDREPS